MPLEGPRRHGTRLFGMPIAPVMRNPGAADSSAGQHNLVQSRTHRRLLTPADRSCHADRSGDANPDPRKEATPACLI